MKTNSLRTPCLALALLCLLAAGCGDKVQIAQIAPPSDYLRRASEFIGLASMCLDQGRSMWGHGIRNIYYAGLTLARMNDQFGFFHHDASVHDAAWRQAPKVARKLFRDEVRPMRNKYDYDVALPPDEPVTEDLNTIASKGPTAFRALAASARDAIWRRHSCSDGQRHLCFECAKLPHPTCKAATVVEELTALEGEIDAVLMKVRDRAGDSGNDA